MESTTYTVETHYNPPPGPKPKPLPLSGVDVREAATHIAHHIESAGQCIAIAIFFGCIIGGCLS